MTYATLAAWIHHRWNALALIALSLVAAQHSYLGLCVVVEDYVHPPGRRITTLLLLQLAHVILAAVAVFAVLQVALGVLA
jgi:succinate dehydrogenase / fumarate reductase membrane anchor subunit